MFKLSTSLIPFHSVTLLIITLGGIWLIYKVINYCVSECYHPVFGCSSPCNRRITDTTIWVDDECRSGWCCITGAKRTQMLVDRIEYTQQAADKGDLDACFYMGQFYVYGVEQKNPYNELIHQDRVRGREYWVKGEELGSNNCKRARIALDQLQMEEKQRADKYKNDEIIREQNKIRIAAFALGHENKRS